MAKPKKTRSKPSEPLENIDEFGEVAVNKPFHLESFKHPIQKLAWSIYQQHDIMFLLGAAGTGKTHLAMAFAVEEVLNKTKNRIILTRPVIEAGENLGFLPGTLDEKVNPYMMPLWDVLTKIVGPSGRQREKINSSYETSPLAYMRGRSQRTSEPVVTPTGMKSIGEIKVGDMVIGSNGKPIKVIGVYPQGKLPIYEVGFSDRTKSVCSGDHLWNTMTLNEKRHNKGFTTKTTLEIAATVKNKHNQKVHRMPLLSGPVEFEKKEVLIDPYLLGVLLGDGSISNQQIKLASADQQIIDECLATLPEGYEFVYQRKYEYRMTSGGKRNIIKEELRNLELLGKKSYNKFVPNLYKFNSPEVRLAILQGLLDTDGWICKHRSGNCRIQFCSASRRLAEDVMFLVRSLGGLSYCRLREFDESDSHELNGKIIKHVNNLYNVDIMLPMNPFRLQRKAEQYSNNQKFTKLVSYVKSIGEDECVCIQVDAPDQLYLTNDFTVTHNTFDDSVCILDEAQNCTKAQLKLFLTRMGTNSKMIVTGDPRQSDLGKGDPDLVDVVYRLESLKGVGLVQFNEECIVRHPLVGEILKRLEK